MALGDQHTWTPTGTGDTLLDVDGILTGVGRVGGQYDAFGASVSRPRRYAWRAKFRLSAAGTFGEAVEFYIATARRDANTAVDGELGTVDAEIAAADTDKVNNCKHIGNVWVDDENATPPLFRGSGIFILAERYVSPVLINATSNTFGSTTSDFEFEIEEIGDAL